MKKNKFLVWEFLNYLCLTLCIFGQMTVGYVYMIAQIAYLVANGIAVMRDVKIKMPVSNLVKDSCFLAITVGLIVIRLVVGGY